MRRDNHPDDVIEHLTLPEDVADLILFLVTQPARRAYARNCYPNAADVISNPVRLRNRTYRG